MASDGRFFQRFAQMARAFGRSALLASRCRLHQPAWQVASCTCTTSSSSNTVTYERSGDVCLIGIDRPHRRNAVDVQTGRRLAEVVRRFNEDEELRVAVLYGHGAHFCAGFDLGELAADDNEGSMHMLAECENDVSVRPMGLTGLLEVDKPMLAAVQGYCVAGGLELAIACDMRIVDKSTIFGVFSRRFGVPLIDGGTVRLPKLIGLGRAMDMILTGRPVDAELALQWGLADRITEKGTALGEAVKQARVIAKYPAECVRADRRSAYYGAFGGADMADCMRFELRNGLPCIRREAVYGAKHFATGAGRSGSFKIGKWTGAGYEPPS